MPVDILYDGIQPADLRPPIEEAVIGAVGNRPERWRAWLAQGGSDPGFSIRIDGPDGAQFSYRFLKPRERTPDFVLMKIREGLRNVSRNGAW